MLSGTTRVRGGGPIARKGVRGVNCDLRECTAPKRPFRLRRPGLPALLGRGVAAALLLVSGCAAAPQGGGDGHAGAAELAPSPLGHYLAGRHAKTVRDLDAAADLMAFVLATDPDNLDLLRQTYLLTASEGRMAEAAALAERLQAIDGSDGPAALTLALEAIKAGEWARADEILAAQPTEGINSFYLPMVRAWLAFELKGVDAALEAVAPLQEVRGLVTLHHMHAGLLNDLGGRLDAAEESYRKTAETSTRLPFRLVEIFGDFYRRAGRAEDARALYDEYAEANPGSVLLEALGPAQAAEGEVAPVVATTRDGVAEALFNLASVLQQDETADLALVFNRMALDLRPDLPIARLQLAEILAGQDRIDDAIALYRTVPPDSAFGWQARLAVAESLNQIDDGEAAIRLLREMTAERPDRFDAPLSLGNILRGKERFAEAAEAYDLAVERLGTLEARHWSILYFRGIARERSDKWPLAEVDFLKALELEPEHPYVMNYLAYSWIEQGEHYDRALAMLEKAVSLRPDDGYIVDSLGWVFYRLGRYEEAVVELERAIELRPQDSVINDHLGDAYWKVGRHHEARFQWRRALQFEPEADQVGLIEGKIERGLTEGPTTARSSGG